MDNQHRKIKATGELVALIQSMPDMDARWAAIAKTNLQQGFMALTRSVAKPDFF